MDKLDGIVYATGSAAGDRLIQPETAIALALIAGAVWLVLQLRRMRRERR